MAPHSTTFDTALPDTDPKNAEPKIAILRSTSLSAS